MMKYLLITTTLLGLQMVALASPPEMPTDDLVSAEEMLLDQEQTHELVSSHVVCYARDRWGYLYSASHPHAGQAQNKAMRACQRSSRSACYAAGCRYPTQPPAPRPYPGYPGRRGD